MEAHLADIRERLEEVDVVVLPIREEEGKGTYPEGATALKHLRAVGLKATYLHDNNDRQWLHLLGEGEVALVLAIAINLFSSASWDLFKLGIKNWVGSLGGNPPLRIKIDAHRSDDQRTMSVELEGKGSDVIEALERLPQTLLKQDQDDDD
jgi:hypothetical protein